MNLFLLSKQRLSSRRQEDGDGISAHNSNVSNSSSVEQVSRQLAAFASHVLTSPLCTRPART